MRQPQIPSRRHRPGGGSAVNGGKGDTGRPALARVRMNPSRTGEGKKIDTWRIDLPNGGFADVEIRLHASVSDSASFEAQTRHPELRDLGPVRASDLNDLRLRLSRAVEELLEARHGETWRPALLVETGAILHRRSKANSTEQARCLEVRFEVEPLRANAQPAGQNMPVRDVLRGPVRHRIVERGRSDTFPKGEELGEQVRWSNERGTPVARILVEDDAETRERLDAIEAALRGFGEALADRLSPGRIHDGLPSPDELVELMRAAADAPRQTPESDPEPDFFP